MNIGSPEPETGVDFPYAYANFAVPRRTWDACRHSRRPASRAKRTAEIEFSPCKRAVRARPTIWPGNVQRRRQSRRRPQGRSRPSCARRWSASIDDGRCDREFRSRGGGRSSRARKTKSSRKNRRARSEARAKVNPAARCRRQARASPHFHYVTILTPILWTRRLRLWTRARESSRFAADLTRARSGAGI